MSEKFPSPGAVPVHPKSATATINITSRIKPENLAPETVQKVRTRTGKCAENGRIQVQKTPSPPPAPMQGMLQR